MKPSPLRAIPSVEKMLLALGDVGLPRPAIVAIVRRELATLRAPGVVPGFDRVLADVHSRLADFRQSRIQPVINGAGILVHTNLGRAPLGPEVVQTLAGIAASYNNLEYDLKAGERGSRASYLEHNLALLCGAPAATVTNNCAAALILILRHFTSGVRKDVIISRGELVQIGGGFRIPDILEASGARLREVGTTNRTSAGDFARAIGRDTALLLKVHRSNFFMGGFVESPAPGEIAALARRKHIPFVEDLGSGAMVATEKLAPIEHEPTPAEVLETGVDLVCFSGDKLLGGPQAGLIAGKARFIAALKREPFFRALRCDKLILAALQTTVDLYLNGTAINEVPTLAMLRLSNDDLRARAAHLISAVAGLPVDAAIGEGEAKVGGGTLPRSAMTSVSLDLRPAHLTLADLAARLRAGEPPVIGVISGRRFRIHLRTVLPHQDEALARVLRAAFTA